MQTACGIDDHRVAAVVPGVFHGFLGDLHGISLAPFEHFHADLTADHLQLLDGCGTIDVAGDQQGLFAAFFNEVAQFCRHGGLARALQAAEHINCGRLGRIGKLGVLAAHELGELVVYDLDDLLAGSEASQDFLPHGAFGDFFDEVLDHQEVDVRFQKRQTHFPQGALYILLGKLSAIRELFKGALQFVGQSLKGHSVHLSMRRMLSSASRIARSSFLSRAARHLRAASVTARQRANSPSLAS